MNRTDKSRRARAGLLLIASPRFKNLSGPKRGTYGERKDKVVKEIKATMDFMDLVDPGIVYERADAEKALRMFFDQKGPVQGSLGKALQRRQEEKREGRRLQALFHQECS